MADIAVDSLPFQPKPSKSESKAETTNAAARAILDAEAARRDAKTARLRAARIAAEEATPAAAPVKSAPKSRRKA